MLNKIIKFTCVFLSFCILQANAITEDEDIHFHIPKLENGITLSIEDCVALAYKNSPKIKRKKYELDIAKSNVKLAQSAYFPIISAGVGFQYERNTDSVYYDKKYRDLPNVGVMINKMVWDFGKTTALVNMEKFFQIGAEYEFTDELCHTLFDIKAKYYNILKNTAIAELAKKDVELNKEFVKISAKPIDKSTAELYLSNAQTKYINAQGDVDIAMFDLANAMYLDKNLNFSIKKTPTFKDYKKDENFIPIAFPFKEQEAVEIAYKNSPDLMVLINTKNAMEQSLKYEKRQSLPELSTNAGYNMNDTYDGTNNNFSIGVNLTSDVNLMELKYNIKKASSELQIADNEIELFKKDLYYEVLRALSNVDCYEQQLSKLREEADKSDNTMNLVIDKYKNNELDYTSLQDSRKDYIETRKKYIECLYNYNMSIIQTEMAMHYHLVDIHHKAEHALHHHSHELIEHLNDALDCNKQEKKTKNKGKNK
ncbi:MAG: TolC family protein [Candidatus Gastranaerophilales bacterium]|nr:TolC family protein [Candidatus Gastranaerophilales bacterium]